jgi:rubredoxin
VVAVSLRVTTYSLGRKLTTLTSCPFCGYEFDAEESRPSHPEREHGPADAGLPPLGEIPADHDAPLFGGGGR